MCKQALSWWILTRGSGKILHRRPLPKLSLSERWFHDYILRNNILGNIIIKNVILIKNI